MTAAVKVEQDDAVVDELLAVVVGDSVDSDFEELVKAQLDEDGSGAEQQIQQIHERIIVGIEGSSGSEEEDKPSEAENVVQVQEVVSEVTEEVLGSEEVEPPSVDVPDCKVDSEVTPETMASADNDYEDVQVESNQGKCWDIFIYICTSSENVCKPSSSYQLAGMTITVCRCCDSCLVSVSSSNKLLCRLLVESRGELIMEIYLFWVDERDKISQRAN